MPAVTRIMSCGAMATVTIDNESWMAYLSSNIQLRDLNTMVDAISQINESMRN